MAKGGAAEEKKIRMSKGGAMGGKKMRMMKRCCWWRKMTVAQLRAAAKKAGIQSI